MRGILMLAESEAGSVRHACAGSCQGSSQTQANVHIMSEWPVSSAVHLLLEYISMQNIRDNYCILPGIQIDAVCAKQ